MTQIRIFLGLIVGLPVLLSACSGGSEPAKDSLFARLDSTRTGIRFQNQLHETDSLSILDYLYFYNGGGVAAGDFNNDGKTDLYFVSNQQPNQLYLNRGGMQFDDVTQKANADNGKSDWQTGVTVADVNGDGWLDIYVCAVSQFKGLKGTNQLYINNGPGPKGPDGVSIPTFTERAAEYGLDFTGFSTQATFFDYDHDGDLDCFLLNHAVHTSRSYDHVRTRLIRNRESGDYLFRNNGGTNGFTDVSEQAGIFATVMGYGLGVSVADINNDGWEDLYISNDFHEDDYYYVNNQKGGFREEVRKAFGHTSRFSMGNDVADINNDGFQDVISVDMYPEDPAVEKASNGEDPLDIYQYKLTYGYMNQYTRNCLQLSMAGQRFIDIGLMAGIAATDWSWAPLLADFDNDGIKDLFISNGIVRRPNDLEYLKYISSQTFGQNASGEALAQMPDGRVHPYLYKGTDSLQFVDKSLDWGFAETGYTNGAAYADLDNDGDLDLITNNINSPAGIFENRANTLTSNHFLQINLVGTGANRFGVGAKVVLKTQTGLLLQQNSPTRGFMSSVEPRLTFGLGGQNTVDSLWVLWPDGTGQIMTGVKANQTLTLAQTNARPGIANPVRPPAQPLFAEGDSAQVAFRHAENMYFDFGREPLLPFKVSTEGPRLSVADVNADGLDDFFVGGARHQTSCLFVQQPNGTFRADSSAFRADANCEDVGSLFFDADGDGDADLYVVSGGNEFTGQSPELLDRLYLNDGAGRFRKDSLALPSLHANKSSVAAADIDRDGDLDLFVAGRVVGFRYGQSPPSFLLINEGKGRDGRVRFSDQTARRAPALQQGGMLTDAFWHDLDRDGDPDLVTAGHWGPIRVYKNEGGNLTEADDTGLAQAVGFWQTLKPADLDGDGDMDFLAGNLGQNTKFRRGTDGAVRLYARDYTNSGARFDQVMAYRYQNKWYPVATKDELGKSLPFLNKRFDNYRDFSGKTLEEIFESSELPEDGMREVNTFESVWIENLSTESDKSLRFRIHKLPALAQTAPVFAFDVQDVTGDGRADVLLGGNFYSVSTYQGRYDASYGLLLRNHGKGKFTPVLPTESGLVLRGEIRAINHVRTGQGPLVLVARNGAPMQVFRPLRSADKQ